MIVFTGPTCFFSSQSDSALETARLARSQVVLALFDGCEEATTQNSSQLQADSIGMT